LKNAPIKLERTGNNVTITAYITFKGNYAEKKLDAGYTYGEAAASSIEKKWSGDFMIYGCKINVATRVFSSSRSPNNVLRPAAGGIGQRFLKIKIIGGTIASKIMRSHERLSWTGILKNDETISVWSVAKSSSPIVIYVTENFQGSNPYKLIGKSSFEGLAAHEFGHALGLGDAYNAGYRGGKLPWTLDGFYAPKSYAVRDKSGKIFSVSVPDNDMMLYNGNVSDNDMRMVLEAYETGVQQFFPRGSKEWRDR
jgi:hypothetical protein